MESKIKTLSETTKQTPQYFFIFWIHINKIDISSFTLRHFLYLKSEK